MRNRTITVTKRSLTLSPLDVVWAPATRPPIPMRLGGFCDSDCGTLSGLQLTQPLRSDIHK